MGRNPVLAITWHQDRRAPHRIEEQSGQMADYGSWFVDFVLSSGAYLVFRWLRSLRNSM